MLLLLCAPIHSTITCKPLLTMSSIIRASVAQCGTVHESGDSDPTQATLVKLRSLAQLAKTRDNSQLVVFPEAFVGGYPKFSTFGSSIGTRSPEGRNEYVAYYKRAIVVPGPEIDQIATIAKEIGIFIVTGFIEKDRGTVYCACGFFSPEHGFLYKRRKLMPTAMEKLIWGFGTAEDTKTVKSTFTAAETGSGGAVTKNPVELTLAGVICWENMMPLFRTHVYEQGTQIYCAPTVDGRESWEPRMRHIAHEGRCFVLSCCQDFPANHAIEGARDPEGIMIHGGSLIVNPLGEVIAGPLRDEEGILTADLDLDLTIAGKFDLDVVGHYARPDLFKLIGPQA